LYPVQVIMKVVTVILIITCFATCARRDMERIHLEVAKAKAYLEKKKQEQQFMEEAEALEVIQQETDEEKKKQEQQSMEEAETGEVVQQEEDEDTKKNVEMEMPEATDTTEAGQEQAEENGLQPPNRKHAKRVKRWQEAAAAANDDPPPPHPTLQHPQYGVAPEGCDRCKAGYPETELGLCLWRGVCQPITRRKCRRSAVKQWCGEKAPFIPFVKAKRLSTKTMLKDVKGESSVLSDFDLEF